MHVDVTGIKRVRVGYIFYAANVRVRVSLVYLKKRVTFFVFDFRKHFCEGTTKDVLFFYKYYNRVIIP